MIQYPNTLQPECKKSCALNGDEFTYYYANNTNSHPSPRSEPVSEFLSRFDEYHVGPGSNGPLIAMGDFAGGNLTKQAWKAATGVVLDVNTGIPFADVVSAVEAAGHLAVCFTASDHGRTETTIRSDSIKVWLARREAEEFGQAGVVRYLREVLGWCESILATARYSGDKFTAKGAMAVIAHDPFSMTRVIMPFAKPFDPTKDAKTASDAVLYWGALVKAVVGNLGLSVHLDKNALDPVRAAYLPRCPKGAEHKSQQVDGAPLDWEALKVTAPAPKTTTAPTFDTVKKMIDALPPKSETPDPTPVVEMIARLDNGVHRETLLEALKRKVGGGIIALRRDVQDRRRAAGDGPEEGVKTDKETGFRTFVHVADPDDRQARAFLVTTMEKANVRCDDPLFTLNMGQIMALRRYDGRARFETLNARQFQAALFKFCSFAVHRDGSDLIHRIPESDVCGIVLDGLEPGELPQQPTIRRAPTMARDGRILDRDGWFGDVLVDLGDLTPPVVPSDPTPAEIEAARDLITEDVLGDFPFDDGDEDGAKGKSEASRANAVGMLLTPFARDLFDGPSPIFAIVKPSAGVGGTLLAETVQRVFDGRASATTPNSRNEEEMQKHLLAAALGNDSFLFFDNVTDLSRSETLKRSTTADQIGGRILGVSKTVSRPNDFMWIVTGINPRLGPEMARRSVFINLNSRVEDNSSRNYQHSDFKAWLGEERSKVIGALLTLTRAWWMAGHKPGKTKLASFESWSGVVGGILETAGIKGFLDNPRKVSTDREGGEIKAFVAEWWKKFGPGDTTESEIFNHAVAIDSAVITGFPEERRRLFGETLDGLRGRTFDLEDCRVMFGAGEREGWRLVQLAGLAKAADPDLENAGDADCS